MNIYPIEYKNIGYDAINELLSLYDSLEDIDCCIDVSIEDSQKNGEIDPVFISYCMLFLYRFPKLTIKFNLLALSGHHEKGRLFSFAYLYSQLINFSGFYHMDRLSVESVPKVSKETVTRNYIPPLFIDKNTISVFFDKAENKPDNAISPLVDKYKETISTNIDYWTDDESAGNLKNRLNDREFCYLEYFLLGLLIRGKKDKEKFFYPLIDSGYPKKTVYKKNSELISYYFDYVRKLSNGLFELANNIVQHARPDNVGVITARIFENERLKELKTPVEKNYLQWDLLAKEEYSGNDDKSPWFLDINIVDLGSDSFKKNYCDNLNNHTRYFSSIGDKVIKKQIEQGIECVQGYHFKDFFIIDKKYFETVFQQNKLITRYGLIFFSKIILDELNGFIKVSSNGSDEYFSYFSKSKVHHEDNRKSYTNRGTAYNCIIPIKSNLKREENDKSENKLGIGPSSTVFEDLKKYTVVHVDHVNYETTLNKPEPNIVPLISYTPKPCNNENTEVNTSKYETIFELYNEIGSLSKIDNSILLLNYNDLGTGDEFNLVRLLSAINVKFKDIIIYNIDEKKTKNIIDIRRRFSDYIGKYNDEITAYKEKCYFWSADSRVLFYSHKTKEVDTHTYKRHGATVLAGKNISEYNYINRDIWLNRYSFREHQCSDINNDTPPDSDDVWGNLFFCNKKLNYFDLLIKNTIEQNNTTEQNNTEVGIELSLFEESVQYSLNTEFKSKTEITDTYNKGYKISETHFRLGSKIHIENFYYAKKMFQNDFFVLPLAFSVAKNIDNLYEEKDKKITLVGYESYSSLLISNVRYFLSKYFNFRGLNHCLISSDGVISIEPSDIKNQAVILVPIASTFSTSIKIKNKLESIIYNNRSNDSDNFCIDSYIHNIVLVADIGSFKQSDKLPPILEEQNWKSISIEDKQVKVEPFDKLITKQNTNEVALTQRFYIPVYTKWHDAHSCQLCFPDKENDKEKCLIETSKTSVTPEVIFALPKVKKAYGSTDKFINLDYKNALLFGNIERYSGNYLYYSRTATMIKNNDVRIKAWLTVLKKKFSNLSLFNNRKVVLVTPDKGSKSGLIDMVNEYLFDFSANCLNITSGEDYIENSETLYEDALNQADYVIFVDDVLATAKSFLRTNYIVRHIGEKDTKAKNNNIDFCICLINRMSYSNEQNLLLKLSPKKDDEKLFYFNKIYCPTIEEPNGESPIDKEKRRYETLAKKASLDSMIHYFTDKAATLSKVSLNSYGISEEIKDYEISNKEINNIINKYITEKIEFDHSSCGALRTNLKLPLTDKKLFQYLTLNAVFKIFSEPSSKVIWKGGVNPSLNDEFKVLIETVGKELSKDTNNKEIIKKHIKNLPYVLLKLLCVSPLIHYHDIRIAAFSWVIQLFEEMHKTLNEEELDKIYENVDETGNKNIDKICSNLKKISDILSDFQNFTDKPRSDDMELIIDFQNSIFYQLYGQAQILNKINLKISDEIADEMVLNKSDQKFESYSLLSSYKLLLKKSVQLNSNHIISKEFLRLICKLIDFHRDNQNELEKAVNAFNKAYIQYIIEKEKDKKGASGDLFAPPSLVDNICLIKFPNSEKIIFDIIALIKELIHKNESKSFQLEKNINSILKEKREENIIRSYDSFHFLRLLQLENTEALSSFWQHFRDKSLLANNNEGQTLNFKESLELFQATENEKTKDRRYELMTNFFDKNEGHKENQILNAYLEIKTFLYNKRKDQKDHDFTKGIDDLIKLIKKLISCDKDIINATLVINHKKISFGQFPTPEEDAHRGLFIYPISQKSKDKDKDKDKDISTDPKNYYSTQHRVSNSIVFNLFNNEWYERQRTSYAHILNKEGKCTYRKSHFPADFDKSSEHLTEIKQLKEGTSVLFLNIPNGSIQKSSKNDFRYATIVLFLGAHIKDSKAMRALLSLRQEMGDFLSSRELFDAALSNADVTKRYAYLKDYNHYFKEFFELMASSSKESELETVNIVRDCLVAQFELVTKNNYEIKEKSFKDIKNYIDLIFNSKLAQKYYDSEIVHYIIQDDSVICHIPDSFYRIIIPQLIINIKQYSTFKKDSVKISLKCENNKFIFIFENNIHLKRLPEESKAGRGLLLCDDIVHNFMGNTEFECHFYYENDVKNNIFKVELAWTDNNFEE